MSLHSNTQQKGSWRRARELQGQSLLFEGGELREIEGVTPRTHLFFLDLVLEPLLGELWDSVLSRCMFCWQ